METDKIPALFGATGIREICKVKTGHINRTFIVTSDSGKYVLQSLNRKAFPDPEAVMSNIRQVEAEFRNCTDIDVPHFLSCGDKNFARADGDIWRMYNYCEGSPCKHSFYRAGFAYGTFIRIMSCSGASILHVSDGFHDFRKYFTRLTEVCPAESVPPVLTALEKRLEHCFDGVPLRIIHGDAKTDNILIGERCTVLDLDTVMVGTAALDYGDMVRSVCSDGISAKAVRELTQGFREGIGGLLTEAEKNSLYSGILWMTGELAVRYLTDYYSKDRYFHGKTCEQCLIRSDELLKQLDSFLEAEAVFKSIITE